MNTPGLFPCPISGAGVHSWIFSSACFLARGGASPSEAIATIKEGLTRPPGPFNEVEKSVEAAFSEIGQNSVSGFESPRREKSWPDLDKASRAAIVGQYGGTEALKALSPDKIEGVKAEDFIDKLFPGNPLLCIGRGQTTFDTKTREEWRGSLRGQELIVPSPMLTRRGWTKAGTISAHSLQATGSRRFLVVEQDYGTFDEQASVLLHLANPKAGAGPLALAVMSGGKSVHGWFSCAGANEDSLRLWFSKAVKLGADPQLWTRSQFCRLPGGTRSNGQPQPVIFLNQLAIPTL